MGFPPGVVEDLLVRCHRRCCVCHRWCGVKMELDHIIPQADGGSDDADNAIWVCFECHAEIHGYNDRHPRGRKFHASELRSHRDQWLEICRARPEIFIQPMPYADAGPLEALIEELGFNEIVASADQHPDIACPFHDDQFRRALDVGALSTLRDDLKRLVHEAYASIGKANNYLNAKMAVVASANQSSVAHELARQSAAEARGKIKNTHEALVEFLHQPE